jgi:ribosomal-protein-alanine N-acetyltransferase
MPLMSLITLAPAHEAAIADLDASLFERPFTADALASLFASPAFTGYALVDEAGDIMSFILMNQVLDEAEILSLGTARAQQAKGHACQLLNDTCAVLLERGVCRIYLDVAEANRPARALYARCGFVESGRRLGYYGTAPHRQDAIIMSKALKDIR